MLSLLSNSVTWLFHIDLAQHLDAPGARRNDHRGQRRLPARRKWSEGLSLQFGAVARFLISP